MQAERHDIERTTTNFDLAFLFHEYDGNIYLNLEYNTDLFRDGTIVITARRFVTLLEQIILNPDCPVGAYELTLPEEQQLEEVGLAIDFDFHS